MAPTDEPTDSRDRPDRPGGMQELVQLIVRALLGRPAHIRTEESGGMRRAVIEVEAGPEEVQDIIAVLFDEPVEPSVEECGGERRLVIDVPLPAPRVPQYLGPSPGTGCERIRNALSLLLRASGRGPVASAQLHIRLTPDRSGDA
jgi:hypothetical protein